MRNFWELCYFEQKKLFKKKYVQIAFFLMIMVTIWLNISPFFQKNQVAWLDENNEMVIEEVSYIKEVQLERKFAKQFNGSKLTNEIVSMVKEFNDKHLEKARMDNDEYLIPMNVRLPFRSVYNIGVNPGTEIDNPADFAYQYMFGIQKIPLQVLSTEEVRYWIEKQETVHTPFTMYYARGYGNILEKVYWLNILGLVFIVLCLCSSFSEEHICRTDPIVRAARFGTNKLSVVKLVAGELVAGMTIVLSFGITVAIQLGVHGIGGAKAAVQIQDALEGLLSDRFGELTMGKAVWIVFAVSLLLALMMGALTMILSKLFRQSVPVIVISFSIFLVPFFFSNMRNSDVGQFFSYFPFQRLEAGEFLTDVRMVKLAGNLLTATQASVLLYGVLTVLILGICMIVCRATVKERN